MAATGFAQQFDLPAIGLPDQRPHAVEAPPEPRKALDELWRFGEPQNGRDGPLILIANQAKNALGIRPLRHEFGIKAGDFHVGEIKRFFDLIDRQPEAARALEHVLEEKPPLLAAVLEKTLKCGTEPIPAGDD